MKLEIIEVRKWIMLNETRRTENSRFRTDPKNEDVMSFMYTAIRNGTLRSTTTRGSRAIYKGLSDGFRLGLGGIRVNMI